MQLIILKKKQMNNKVYGKAMENLRNSKGKTCKL